jgi:hypothetical protein
VRDSILSGARDYLGTYLRKPAQRAVAASRNVEVGGRGGWVRGRAMAGPEVRDSSAVAVRRGRGGGRGERGAKAECARCGAY